MATFPKWKNIRQIEDGQEVYPGVRAVASYGHTPGHTSYIVSSGKKQLLVGGDLPNIQALNMKNPGMHLIVELVAQARIQVQHHEERGG